MKKYIFISCAIATLSLAGFAYFRNINSSITNPSDVFKIPSNEVDEYQKRATNGDCQAAIRLTRYHMYLTLHYDDALKWAHMAAKCPQLEPKELLITLLYQSQDQSQTVTEIDKLILEIQEIDPKRAIEIKEQVRHMKRP